MTALLQCVPDKPNAFVVIESANGVGGYFYDMWLAAVEGKVTLSLCSCLGLLTKNTRHHSPIVKQQDFKAA